MPASVAVGVTASRPDNAQPWRLFSIYSNTLLPLEDGFVCRTVCIVVIS